ncbi:MAG: S1 family peptidase [Solirubrobacterales bacterium]
MAAWTVCVAFMMLSVASAAANSPTPLNEKAVSAYKISSGLSDKAARERLFVQSQGASLAEELESRLGAGFGGVYYDNKSNKIIVQLAPRSGSGLDELAARAAAKAKFLDGGARFESVEYSKEHLQSVLDKVGRGFVSNKSLQGRTSASIDVRRNRVSVEYDSSISRSEVVDSLDKILDDSDPVIFMSSGRKETKVQPAICTFPFCTKPMRGGVEIFRDGGTCSAGFVAKQGASRYLITAGHCGASGTAWKSEVNPAYPNNLSIGTMVASSFGLAGDWGAIAMTGYWGENAQGGYFANWGTGNPLDQTYATRSPIVGSFGCRYGRTSGFSCGTVDQTNVTVAFQGGPVVGNLFRSSGCARFGDSGGTWVGPDNTLGGVVSGSTNAAGTTCPPVGTDLIFMQDARIVENLLAIEAEHRPAEMIPLAGDWDGNGSSTPGYFRPRTAQWFLSNSLTNPPSNMVTNGTVWGTPTMRPVVGNWDGIGGDGVGLFDTVTAKWYLSNSASSPTADALNGTVWGTGSMQPLAGNWDGVGGDGIGFFHPSTASWFLSNSSSSPTADAQPGVVWGTSSMKPITGNWDGSGGDGIGLFHPPSATWFLTNSVAAPASQVMTPYPVWGTSVMKPISGNWDATGGDGVGLLVQSSGAWYFSNPLSPPTASVSVDSWGSP